ncbi:MAG: tetratricopeptide repeat protein, partial [Muribaculaceae bacterium]|nr:tetratricopeptide repeat protein [Muribaculaceae bacterium]
MKHISRILLLLIVALLPLSALAQDKAPSQEIKTVKQERVHIRKGNKLFKEKRYAEAEVEFRKAAQANPGSPIAAFNLAAALLKQDNGAAKSDDPKSPANQAQTQLENIIKTCPNKELTSKAFYNLGNIAFNREDWDKAIDNYKNALRRNPADNEARDNLRLAQLKKQQSDNNKDQNQNKDQNKDQQDQNKDQNKDQD